VNGALTRDSTLDPDPRSAPSSGSERLRAWIELLRWHKPSGRLILLIPAGWSLWLTPDAPPPADLVALILLGGLAVSGAGCVANDLWDRRIDPQVKRTRCRPIADGRIGVAEALLVLALALALSLLVVLALPSPGRGLCLLLAVAALPPVLLYPTAKRWFALPQAVLALCWGFAVLIPWAAATGALAGGWPLLLAWLATVSWTFGFDTVYAMADRDDDRRLMVRSSALTLGRRAPAAIAACYAITALALALGAGSVGVNAGFWWLWALAALGMGREVRRLMRSEAGERRGGAPTSRGFYGQQFAGQVRLGGLLLLALVLGRAG
jgi:4-hydroxybenzoate polyprenyltransferase